MRDVYISGIGMTVFTKQPDKTLKNLTAGAVNEALADAGIGVDAVERVFFGNAVAGAITRQEMVKGQILLRPLGFEGISITKFDDRDVVRHPLVARIVRAYEARDATREAAEEERRNEADRRARERAEAGGRDGGA